MKGEQDFFMNERLPPGLPLDTSIPLTVWAGLPMRQRAAWYLADILSTVADVEQLLATHAAAHLRWIKPELAAVARRAGDALKGLTC
ncbi:MAG TPA: hypothetical protein VI670_07310 [Thermoanaerobaculia bacterium]|jgi:hypothetical protein